MFLAIDINFLFVGHISQPFLREIPKYMRGSSCSLFCKFQSSFSGDFERVFSRHFFLPCSSSFCCFLYVEWVVVPLHGDSSFAFLVNASLFIQNDIKIHQNVWFCCSIYDFLVWGCFLLKTLIIIIAEPVQRSIAEIR